MIERKKVNTQQIQKKIKDHSHYPEFLTILILYQDQDGIDVLQVIEN